MELILAGVVVCILFTIGSRVREAERLEEDAWEYVMCSLENDKINILPDQEQELVYMYYCFLKTENMERLYEFNDKYNTYHKGV